MSGPIKNFPAAALPSADPPRWWRAVKVVSRFLLAAVFLAAALPKVTHPRDFENQIMLHSGLPVQLGWLIVRFLPWLELTCGLCLLTGYAHREAGVLVALLLVMFLAYHMANLHEGACGCFLFSSPGQERGGWWHILGDLVLLLGCIPAMSVGDKPA